MAVSVYLDQAEWIDLSRAMHSRADGERFRDALGMARHSVAMGVVEFPLSNGHYIETWRVGDPARRARLARTMIDLSRGRTLAKPPDLCDNKLDAFIARTAGIRPPRPPVPPLRWGFAHASCLLPRFPQSRLNLNFELRDLSERPAGFDATGAPTGSSAISTATANELWPLAALADRRSDENSTRRSSLRAR